MRNVAMGSILLSVEILKNQWVITGGIALLALIVLLVVLFAVFRSRGAGKAAVIKLSGEGPLAAWSQDSYAALTERIRKLGGKRRSILFASAEPEHLPAAIPAAVAGILAKAGKKCLLIDLDLMNDSAAKTFHIGTGQAELPGKVVSTRIENLSVWPAHNFTQLNQMNVREIVEKAQDKFDIVLLNAPALPNSPDRRQILSASACAFLCGRVQADTTALVELIKDSDCRIVGSIQIP